MPPVKFVYDGRKSKNEPADCPQAKYSLILSIVILSKL
jgi:hypothetical protein